MPAPEPRVMIVTGTRKGIGRHLAEHYCSQGFSVHGCSRGEAALEHPSYTHHQLDVADEEAAAGLFAAVRKTSGRLDVLINNAGVASMNHFLLTPLDTVRRIFETNVVGTVLFAREAAKLMRRSGAGRIVNLTTIAVPLKLEGESIYAASKAAVISLTEILARELAELRITVNAVGPAPIRTDLIKGVPEEKIARLLERLAIHEHGQMEDVANVIDFFISPTSHAVTGQVVFLGGP